MTRIVLLLLICFAPYAAAEDLSQNDFAQGFLLYADGKGSFYSVVLPYEVYGGSVQHGLKDVVVFNSEGEVVPHIIRRPQPVYKKLTADVDLPFYPISSAEGTVRDDISLEIIQNNAGDIIRLEKKENFPLQEMKAYLIDMDEVQEYPLKLNFSWQWRENPALVPMVIEESDDLMSWKQIQTFILADLHYLGNRLQHNSALLRNKTKRYLRLTAREKIDAVRLTKVTAVAEPRKVGYLKIWRSFALQNRTEGEIVYLETDFEGWLPVESVKVSFPKTNSLLRVALATRKDNEENWRKRGQKLFYRLNQEELEIEGEALRIKRDAIRYLQLTVLQDGVGPYLDKLRVDVSFSRDELIFLARGTPPFLLAYGGVKEFDKKVFSVNNPLTDLTAGFTGEIIREAKLKEAVELGGKSALVKKNDVAWGKFFLWAVLVSAVILLAYMAFSLFRSMKDSESPPEEQE